MLIQKQKLTAVVDLQAFSSVGLLTQYVTAHACPLIEVNCECELVRGIRSSTISSTLPCQKYIWLPLHACMHGSIILPTLLEKHTYTRYIHDLYDYIQFFDVYMLYAVSTCPYIDTLPCHGMTAYVLTYHCAMATLVIGRHRFVCAH